MGSTLEPLRHTNTILLTTYKRDGTPVGTPVSIAFNDSRASFRSWHKAWKTKRLANNPQVEAAPSTLRGEPTGPAIRHEVVGMTRSASKREAVADLGAAPVVADALDGENVTRAVADAPAGPVHPAVRCARGAVRPPRGDGGGPPGASVAAEGACLRLCLRLRCREGRRPRSSSGRPCALVPLPATRAPTRTRPTEPGGGPSTGGVRDLRRGGRSAFDVVQDVRLAAELARLARPRPPSWREPL
ncbi:MAG: PPOX class F420-dependent oxidoreductase [Actinomycetota bacterium]|nr:PPOX class F420-dependent oxidoreductase [Actinomycetota bacterium]